MSTRLLTLIAILTSFLTTARAQTTLIEWQTNWPVGGTNDLDCGNQQNPPVSSAWFSGTKAFVYGVSNGVSTNLLANVASGSSLTFFTYFSPTPVNTNVPSAYTMEADTGSPIHLSPNETIQATVEFSLTGTAPQNSARGFRFALQYAGTNANVTGGNAGSNNGITGYAQFMNFGTTFGEAPLQIQADTNAFNGNSQLAKGADFVQIGGNGGGTTNDPGFTDGTNYTLVMSITENNPTNVSITTTFLGSTFSNGTSITQTVIDTNYCYTNFDEFIMRPAEGAEAFSTITITSFQVETIVPLPALSSNAYLANLVLSTSGALTPAFASNILSYAATQTYGVSPTVTPTTADPTATINLIYNSVTNPITSGSPSAPLALNADPAEPNVVDLQVTAQDGITVQDYLVSITQIPSQTRPGLTVSKSPSALTFNWPLANLGYRLLVQTNNLSRGISTNAADWGTIDGSTTTNNAVIPTPGLATNEFYRLIYP
jgi:hypothetical protein